MLSTGWVSLPVLASSMSGHRRDSTPPLFASRSLPAGSHQSGGPAKEEAAVAATTRSSNKYSMLGLALILGWQP